MVSPRCQRQVFRTCSNPLGRRDRTAPRRALAILGAGMDPHRKRTIRFVVALTCRRAAGGRAGLHQLLLGQRGDHAEPAADRRPAGKTYQLTGKVAEGTGRSAAPSTSSACATAPGTASVPVRYTGSVPDPFRRGARSSSTCASRAACSSGEKDSLVTKCPSKFTTTTELGRSDDRGPRLPRPRARRLPLRRRRVAVRRPRAAGANGSTPGAAPSTRWRARCSWRFAMLEVGVPALGLLVRAGRDATPRRRRRSSTGRPRPGPRRRGRCCCGCCC